MAIFSPLTDRLMLTSKSSPRPTGHKISRVIVHHWAGTGTSGISRLVHSTAQASANYIIANGQIIGSVPESRRAWTSGSSTADNPAITIEIQNSDGAPIWPVSTANINALTRLIADIADRHGWGKLKKSHVRGHREFQATSCPGPYLWPRLAAIRKNAQKLRTAKTKPTPSKGIFGMVKHAKFDHKVKQTLSADKKYKILRIEDGRSYIVAGGAKFTGQIIVVFDDLAPDQTAMIRVFRGGYKKGATPAVASGRTIAWQEVTGTTGKTFATVPITGWINADYGNGRATRLYVQAKLNSGPATPLTISRVIIEALHD